MTFGGYGTVTQALAHGVPLVVAGLTEDKPEIAARVQWTGSGIYLRTENPSEAELREAINQLLTKPDYKREAQRLSREFGEIDTAAEVTGVLENVIVARS